MSPRYLWEDVTFNSIYTDVGISPFLVENPNLREYLLFR